MFKIDYILSVLADMMITTGETQFVKILTKTSEKQSWYKCAAPVGFNLQIKKKPNLVHYSCLFILYCLLYACVYVIPKSNLLHFCLHVLCLCVFLPSTKTKLGNQKSAAESLLVLTSATSQFSHLNSFVFNFDYCRHEMKVKYK